MGMADEEVLAVFLDVDANMDYMLDYDEVVDYFAEEGLDLDSENQMHVLQHYFDEVAGEDNYISLEELTDFWYAEPTCEQVFNRIDGDEDGQLNMEELAFYMKVEYDSEELAYAWDAINTDDYDDYISYDEAIYACENF